MMTDTQISYALKDKYYLLCSREERILQRLRTRGAKGQGWEGRGVVIKGEVDSKEGSERNKDRSSLGGSMGRIMGLGDYE